MKNLGLILLLVLLPFEGVMGATVSGEGASTDSCYVSSEHFRWQQLIVPGAMIGVGCLGLGNGPLHKFCEGIDERFSDIRGSSYTKIDNWLEYAPLGCYAALGLIPGVKHRNNFGYRVACGVVSYSLMSLMVYVPKHIINERRPDGSDTHSFPSGHAATAFAGAELMRLEYGNGIGAAGYVAATAVGIMRLYNSRHWLNDVLAGAGIGILSARMAYWLLPLERKLFKVRPQSSNAVCVTPFYSPFGGNGGVALVARF